MLALWMLWIAADQPIGPTTGQFCVELSSQSDRGTEKEEINIVYQSDRQLMWCHTLCMSAAAGR